MTSPRTPGIRRHLLFTLALGAVVAASTGTAHADQPVTTHPAGFTDVVASGGTLVGHADRVESRTSAGALAGHFVRQRYCTPFGAGTAIVGFRTLAGRWHVEHGDAAVMIVQSDAGELGRVADVNLPRNRADNVGPWAGAVPAMQASSCIAVQTVVRQRIAAPLLWTSALQEVAIVDQVGPGVADVAAQNTGWITGDTAVVHYTSSDNRMHRGAVHAQVGSGPVQGLGDVPDGRASAALPLQQVADGVHTVTVTRTAWGWTPRSGSTSIRIDRTAPGVPVVIPADTGWTNALTVGVRTDPTADATSGWRTNELQIDGGPWTAAAAGTVDAEGVHTIRARAVDHAGNRSAPSEATVVRIDRTGPVVTALEVAASGATDSARLAFTVAPDDGAPYTGCSITVELARGAGGWNEALSVPAKDLTGRLALDVPMADDAFGPHTLRLTVCDAAGNRTRRTVRFTRTASPTATRIVTPGPRTDRAAAAGLTIAAPSRLSPAFGRTIVLRAVVRRDGTAVGGVPIVLADPAGRTVGTRISTPAGVVAFRLRAARSGPWTMSANHGAEEVRDTVTLRVRPRIRVSTRPRVGSRALRGRIVPAVRGRVVRVQRRSGTRWVTVATVRTVGKGRFATSRRWRAGRYRILVPRQAGWSLSPAAVTLRVGR